MCTYLVIVFTATLFLVSESVTSPCQLRKHNFVGYDFDTVSVQYFRGFLPDIILLTLCYHHGGTRINAMENVGPYANTFNMPTSYQ